MPESHHALHVAEFPRSNAYDPDWVLENQMGPNALWLIEWLSGEMDLRPGMRVLDLGCGTAMTSIFLAKEFDVRVWAADLWVTPDDNWRRVREMDMADRVFPLRTEAHALPFGAEFFDAIVSVDSYQYFGTDDLYLGYVSRFARPGAKIGIVVPASMQPFDGGIPEHLTKPQSNGSSFWEDDCISFQTVQRWRERWEQSNRVDVTVADTLPDGWKLWRDFEVAVEKSGKNIFPSVAEALDADQGRYIGFVRLVGTRKEQQASFNLYDPSLIPLMKSSGE